jgi:hypothetical protein
MPNLSGMPSMRKKGPGKAITSGPLNLVVKATQDPERVDIIQPYLTVPPK